MAANGGDQQNGPGLPTVAAAAVAFVAAIGGLTLTGVLGRVQRNSGFEFAVAISLVLLGAALWLGGAMISTTASRLHGKWLPASWRNRVSKRGAVQGLGVLMSMVGLVLGFVVAVGTTNDIEQPAVTLKASADGLTAVGTAKVSNLSSEDRLTVYIDGLTRDDDGKLTAQRSSNLYQAFVGPDSDGAVSHEATVVIPPGRYDAVGIKAYVAAKPQDCGAYPIGRKPGTDGTGCAIVRLGVPRAVHPELTASWDGDDRKAESLKLTLKAADTSVGFDSNFVSLGVVGVGKSGSSETLYRTVVAVPGTGIVSREIRLPVPDGIKTVCASAAMVAEDGPTSTPACPLKSKATGSAVEVGVPAG